MSKWIEEASSEPGLRWVYELEEVYHSTKSKFQKVDLVKTKPFGKVLLIDNVMQSAELDEFVYHECLVHPAMLYHENPKRVFIGGGGEGSTAREVLKHKSVEKCVMVDIDSEVVDFCKEYLEENKEAFEDKRLELVIDDAKKVLEESKEGYDVIIFDLDDPLEGGPCYWLYTKEFYEMAKSKLNPGGIIVTQSSNAGIKNYPLVFAPVYNTLRQVFPLVRPYSQSVYSFADEWGWNLAFSNEKSNDRLKTVEEIDNAISSRISTELKFLDGELFLTLFVLPKVQRKGLAEEKRVLSKDSFAFIHGAGVSELKPQQ